MFIYLNQRVMTKLLRAHLKSQNMCRHYECPHGFESWNSRLTSPDLHNCRVSISLNLDSRADQQIIKFV